MNQKTGLAAIFSTLCAFGSLYATFSGNPLWGVFLAFISIPLGILGLIISASPRVSGGIVSIIAILTGSTGLVLSAITAVGRILF